MLGIRWTKRAADDLQFVMDREAQHAASFRQIISKRWDREAEKLTALKRKHAQVTCLYGWTSKSGHACVQVALLFCIECAEHDRGMHETEQNSIWWLQLVQQASELEKASSGQEDIDALAQQSETLKGSRKHLRWQKAMLEEEAGQLQTGHSSVDLKKSLVESKASGTAALDTHLGEA